MDGLLLKAVKDNDIKGTEQLIISGVDVNARDTLLNKTPLHAASYKGHKEIAELLIARGADINARDSNGWTPLHEASSKEIAELLISFGAEVNARDNYNRTPLSGATTAELKVLLRKHGARP
jgi:uncharacterized protein